MVRVKKVLEKLGFEDDDYFLEGDEFLFVRRYFILDLNNLTISFNSLLTPDTVAIYVTELSKVLGYLDIMQSYIYDTKGNLIWDDKYTTEVNIKFKNSTEL